MPLRTVLSVAVYLIVLTYSCFDHYFDADDMMNLFGAWHAYCDQVRPTGALFYRAMYEVAGFHPLPFRLAAFALILGNLFLLARLLRHLGRSPATVTAGLIFGCFQGTMWMIYASTGMIYDVLCATFLYAALLVALERPGRWMLFGLLQVAALGAKELAVAIPVLLLLFHWLHRPIPLRLHGIATVLSAGFVAQRFLIKNGITGHPAYTPEFTIARVLECVTAYTNILFSHAFHFNAWTACVLWLTVTGMAIVFRQRRILLGLLLFWAALSPMLTGTPRHIGYVFYMPIFGLALAAGALFSALRRAIPRGHMRTLFAAVCLVLIVNLHLFQKRVTFRRFETPAAHDAIRQLAEIRLPLKPGQTVLLLNPPAPEYEHLAVFTLSLTHKVRDLTVHQRPDGTPTGGYDYVERME